MNASLATGVLLTRPRRCRSRIPSVTYGVYAPPCVTRRFNSDFVIGMSPALDEVEYACQTPSEFRIMPVWGKYVDEGRG